MSDIVTPQVNIDAKKYMDNLHQALQRALLKFQVIGCELQKVDKNNKIFDFTEGIIDKETLYLFRKTIKEGEYERLRDKCRIPRKSQNTSRKDFMDSQKRQGIIK